MLHEILFALLGHTGSIIIEVPELDSQTMTDQLMNGQTEQTAGLIRFMVNPNLNFLSAAEVDQLNKIVNLGAYYKMI